MVHIDYVMSFSTVVSQAFEIRFNYDVLQGVVLAPQKYHDQNILCGHKV